MQFKFNIAQVREATRAVVLDPDYASYELDDIRQDVARKLTDGQQSWLPEVNTRVYGVLQQMTELGELVKSGGLQRTGGYGSRSPVQYRTQARHAAWVKQREEARQARQDTRDAWLAIEVALSAKLGQDVRTDKAGKPDLDLDTWQEILLLMT